MCEVCQHVGRQFVINTPLGGAVEVTFTAITMVMSWDMGPHKYGEIYPLVTSYCIHHLTMFTCHICII